MGVARATNSLVTGSSNLDMVMGGKYANSATQLIAGGAISVTLLEGGNVGIGTTAPATIFHTVKTSDTDMATRWVCDSYSSAAGNQPSGFIGRRARGTVASPTAVQLDDGLMAIAGRGYGATAFSTGSKAYIAMNAAENWTDSAQGTYMSLATTPTGSVTTAIAMTILGSGNVGIGTTSPDEKLQVVGTAMFGEDTTNFTKFESDGTMVMNGTATVWEDLNFDPDRSGGAVATRPDEVTINNNFYSEFTSANNQLCGSAQEIPHEYKLSSTLYPHIHIFLKGGESAGTTGVTFTLYWQLRQSTGTTTGSVPLSATSAQLGTTAGANVYTIYDATGFAGSAELGGQLALTIARTGGDAGDIVVTTYGVHYEIDTIGSRTVSTK